MDNLVFVDLDETLIHTLMEPLAVELRIARYEAQVEAAHAHGDVTTMRLANYKLNNVLRVKAAWEAAHPFPEYDENARVAVRPGAVEGLEALYGLGDVLVLTAARHDYAEAALQRAGLRHLVQQVISTQGDTCLKWTHTRPRVLLDDTHASEKLRMLGVLPEDASFALIQVEPFTANGEAVEPLTDYVPQAHRRLLSQHSASI
jgi:phosphoglycolate phosphatase-like HAD superfamily hydrolase